VIHVVLELPRYSQGVRLDRSSQGLRDPSLRFGFQFDVTRRAMPALSKTNRGGTRLSSSSGASRWPKFQGVNVRPRHERGYGRPASAVVVTARR